MRSIGILGLWLLVWECAGEWGAPFKLMEDVAVDGQATYVDGLTGKGHFVFRAKNKYGSYAHYFGMTPNGDRGIPYNFTKLPALEHGNPFSIVGENNGRDLYIVMVVMRGAYRDLAFVETTSNGEDWSKSIVPRGNAEGDTCNRDMPSLLYTPSERLILFYRKDSYLYYVTRSPDTTVWSMEKRIDLNDCTGLLFTNALFSTFVPVAVPPRVMVHLICKTVRSRWVPLMVESKDNGNNWEVYVSSKYDLTGNISSVLAVNSYDNKVYGVFAQDESEWRRLTLFQYTVGGTWKDVTTGPTSKLAHPRSLRTCTLANVVSLVYYDTTVLKQYSVTEPWKETTVALPAVSSKTQQDQVDCGANHLLATGYKDSIVQAQWFSYPEVTPV